MAEKTNQMRDLSKLLVDLYLALSEELTARQVSKSEATNVAIRITSDYFVALIFNPKLQSPDQVLADAIARATKGSA